MSDIGKSEYELGYAAGLDEIFSELTGLHKIELAAVTAQLEEARANDRCAMAYLSQIREAVGGDDFPDMVKRVLALRQRVAELESACTSEQLEWIETKASMMKPRIYRWCGMWRCDIPVPLGFNLAFSGSGKTPSAAFDAAKLAFRGEGK
jgi:hypothetical protein